MTDRSSAVTLSLAELQPGARATVVGLSLTTGIGRRLLDLGFVPDTEVSVVKRAPLGDPTSYELRGFRVCLRRSEALHIQVRRLEVS